MCNHYAKNVEVIRWAAATAGGLEVPAAAIELPEHTWPKSPAPIVLQDGGPRAIEVMRWGVRVEIKGATKPLVKFVTNARDDSLSKYTWRYSAAQRRCLIPVRAYFEPDGPPGGKWEVRFALKDRPGFFVAGLWDRDPDGETKAFAMVTTGPNELAAKIHDRMPLVLDDAAALSWLGHEPLPADRLAAFFQPFRADRMTSEALPPPTRGVSKEALRASAGELDLG